MCLNKNSDSKQDLLPQCRYIGGDRDYHSLALQKMIEEAEVERERFSTIYK